jgi:hypothetical protein
VLFLKFHGERTSSQDDAQVVRAPALAEAKFSKDEIDCWLIFAFRNQVQFEGDVRTEEIARLESQRFV